jgi:hypothetical protein
VGIEQLLVEDPLLEMRLDAELDRRGRLPEVLPLPEGELRTLLVSPRLLDKCFFNCLVDILERQAGFERFHAQVGRGGCSRGCKRSSSSCTLRGR